ncbi:MAG TPA: porin [Thermoanaerobaculia bacterium]|nr:porin [Thermoanaerobaculia bacterium]
MRRSLTCCLLLACCWLTAPARLEAQSLGVVKPAGKEPTLAIGGLLQVQAEAGDKGDARFNSDNDRFYLRRARLNATGKFLEEFDFRLEGEFAGTLANTSGLRAQLTDAYVTWNRHPAASVRFGQFKTPYGFEQLYGDPRLFTLERSLVNDRLTLSRQMGVQVGGDLLEKRLTYAVGAFNGNGANNNFNDDDRFLVAGRLAGVPWQGKLLGRQASWGVGGGFYTSDDSNVSPGTEFGFDSTPATPDRDNVFSGKREGFGVDSQLQCGPVELWAEYLQTKWAPDSGRPLSSAESEGWYAQGSIYVIPDKLQLVLKLESFEPRREIANDTTETGTAGVSWYLKGHDLKLLLNYLRVRIDGQDDQDKVLARFQVIF